jgi:hypothetical protein
MIELYLILGFVFGIGVGISTSDLEVRDLPLLAVVSLLWPLSILFAGCIYLMGTVDRFYREDD